MKVTSLEILIVLASVLVILIAPFVKFSDVGDGTHTGFVTAVDQRGYIFRNYDVYFKTDASSSQEDLYCVHREDQALADRLKGISASKKLVNIRYKGVRGFGLGLCGSTQIYAVEVQ